MKTKVVGKIANQPDQLSILFVCLGNICRSPTAEGVFRHLVEEANLVERFVIDSAGTAAYHEGNPPDRRSTQAAIVRGIDIRQQRSRPVAADDFERFDYILAMDYSNLRDLKQSCPAEHQEKLGMLLDYHDGETQEVPDPYYGGAQGFEHVLDLVTDASEALLAKCKSELGV